MSGGFAGSHRFLFPPPPGSGFRLDSIRQTGHPVPPFNDGTYLLSQNIQVGSSLLVKKLDPSKVLGGRDELNVIRQPFFAECFPAVRRNPCIWVDVLPDSDQLLAKSHTPLTASRRCVRHSHRPHGRPGIEGSGASKRTAGSLGFPSREFVLCLAEGLPRRLEPSGAPIADLFDRKKEQEYGNDENSITFYQ